jgi:STIP1 homology and U-box containing protein 1
MDPTNHLLYTNRAMARLKLQLYDAVIPDCEASLALLSENMKAHYYLAQAQIELGRLEDAYESAQTAYEMCSGIKTGVIDKAWERSLAPVTALVLRCKKELWEKKEDERLKVRNTLLEESCALMKARKEEQIKKIADFDGSRQEMDDVEREWTEKEQELRRVWDSAADKEGKRREVPDWAIDNITFAVMHDPVMVSLFLICCLLE